MWRGNVKNNYSLKKNVRHYVHVMLSERDVEWNRRRERMNTICITVVTPTDTHKIIYFGTEQWAESRFYNTRFYILRQLYEFLFLSTLVGITGILKNFDESNLSKSAGESLKYRHEEV